MKAERDRKPTFDPEYIRNISVGVYCQRLVDGNGVGAADRMVEKDADGGEKLRGRAGAYDALTRAYLKVLGFEPPPNTAAVSSDDSRGASFEGV